jgi:DNA-binding MarR family transcriptional regulator
VNYNGPINRQLTDTPRPIIRKAPTEHDCETPLAYLDPVMARSPAPARVSPDHPSDSPPDPSIDAMNPLHHDLHAAWGTLIQLFLSQEAQWAAEGHRLGLTPPQIRLIMIIRNDATLLMRDLADALGVGKPYVTALVRQLEDAGYLTTHPSPIDRRAKVLTVTRRGAHACRTLEAALLRLPKAIESLNPESQRNLLELAAALRGSTVSRRP